jgi:membrane protein DedA with SNARE-associated domain
VSITFTDLLFPLGTFASLVAAGLGFPIPEELPVVGAGIWAGLPSTVATFGPLRWLILPLCILGVVISDVLLYGVGRRFGTRLLELRMVRRILPPEKQKEIQGNFHKHGVKVLLFARFLPGIRSPIFIMAGVMRLPLRSFILADGIYAIPGVSLLFFVSWWFGTSFQELVQKFEAGVEGYFKPLLILVALGLVIGYLIYHFLKVPLTTGDPKEVPVIGQVATMLSHKDSAGAKGEEKPHPLEARRPLPLERDHGPPMPQEEERK